MKSTITYVNTVTVEARLVQHNILRVNKSTYLNHLMIYFDKIILEEYLMKRILLMLTVAVALMSTVMATETMLDSSKFPDLKKMNAVLQDPVLTIIGAIEKPESYILKLIAKSPQGSQNITAF